jgi:hypothetical protein
MIHDTLETEDLAPHGTGDDFALSPKNYWT